MDGVGNRFVVLVVRSPVLDRLTESRANPSASVKGIGEERRSCNEQDDAHDDGTEHERPVHAPLDVGVGIRTLEAVIFQDLGQCLSMVFRGFVAPAGKRYIVAISCGVTRVFNCLLAFKYASYRNNYTSKSSVIIMIMVLPVILASTPLQQHHHNQY